MKTLIQTTLFLSLALTSLFANAQTAPDRVSAPEIGIDSAVLGIGLLTGLVALISERRRK
ncbi:hypothetical protein [Methylobacter sp.]|uniref:hypothetical protein n=1 Tax=Methylobacter sp. TaxID=2051955 RepID=UPI0011F5E819|nr:hypothetical protein [Methylobacter sp.]TAK62446.1 MAG: hypothetical protein EPO18_10380 [Methylobacter sp.]